jgi:hypothetical protein
MSGQLHAPVTLYLRKDPPVGPPVDKNIDGKGKGVFWDLVAGINNLRT